MYIFLALQTQNMFVPKMKKHITSYDTMKMRTHQRNTSHNSLQGNNSFQDESKITIDIT